MDKKRLLEKYEELMTHQVESVHDEVMFKFDEPLSTLEQKRYVEVFFSVVPKHIDDLEPIRLQHDGVFYVVKEITPEDYKWILSKKVFRNMSLAEMSAHKLRFVIEC